MLHCHWPVKQWILRQCLGIVLRMLPCHWPAGGLRLSRRPPCWIEAAEICLESAWPFTDHCLVSLECVSCYLPGCRRRRNISGKFTRHAGPRLSEGWRCSDSFLSKFRCFRDSFHREQGYARFQLWIGCCNTVVDNDLRQSLVRSSTFLEAWLNICNLTFIDFGLEQCLCTYNPMMDPYVNSSSCIRLLLQNFMIHRTFAQLLYPILDRRNAFPFKYRKVKSGHLGFQFIWIAQ